MTLGIDYGLAHIGLATSEQGAFATPKETLHIKDPNKALAEVAKRASQWHISQIIIGVSEGKSKHQAEIFGNHLSSMLRLNVIFVDETLSSYEATPLKQEDKDKEHSRAAAIILQRWLDTKN